MSDTVGLIIGGAIGMTSGGVGAYFLARAGARRWPIIPLITYPPCVDCGKPTGSPRLNICDRCHSRRCVAAFDLVAIHHQERWATWRAEVGLPETDGV